jgi:aspartate-semialdehyde dehydrogenase
MKLAVVGATGLVGRKMLQVLQERKVEFDEIYLVASHSSKGKSLKVYNNEVEVIDVNDLLGKKVDVALFSAGSSVSKDLAPKLARNGTFVIDNSSAWRMEKDVPLVVPEINANTINKETKIIANPNCSTIQMVMVLYPLHREYKIKRAVVSTYQSVTGTGKKAVEQLENEIRGEEGEKVYPHKIFMNCLPHCDVFFENGYTREELKLVNETKKILNDYSIKVTATAVRVPVVGGHSESVNVEFEKSFLIEDVRNLLSSSKGVVVYDNPEENMYPMPILTQEKDDVYVGRIRRDETVGNGLNLLIVADNLRKGAATNAVQMLEYLIENKIV